ncbi:MAG: hypothetical protein IH987_08455 [Planctomycetes bacterium]|nr:hypothetical protein [Planctomycetota bacterium]
MSDHQLAYDSDGLRAPSTGRGWVALVSTADDDLAERYRRLLERAEIPFLVEDTIPHVTSDTEPTRTIAVHVPESCLDRASEVVARDHAEASDGSNEEDEILDDDDDDRLDDDPVDDDDDPFLDDGDDDDHFDDDSDDHSQGEPDEP